ncbi:MAG: type II toxin-antitoxin system prevent-host-death family antitoxin [Candidatus Methylomirabilales bacterium]
MAKMMNITEARSKLTKLVRDAFMERKRIFIGKHGIPMAALLPIAEYEEILQDLEDLRDMHDAEIEYLRRGGRDFEEVVKNLKRRR